MATSLDVAAIFQLVATQTNANALSTPNDPVEYLKQILITQGTAADEADQLWYNRVTIAGSSSGDLDLAAGGMVSPLTGATLTFVEVVAVYIFPDADNPNPVRVGGATNAAKLWFVDVSDKLDVQPGGMMIQMASHANPAWAVTAATADILGLANPSTGSITFDIFIIGRSA